MCEPCCQQLFHAPGFALELVTQSLPAQTPSIPKGATDPCVGVEMFRARRFIESSLAEGFHLESK